MKNKPEDSQVALHINRDQYTKKAVRQQEFQTESSAYECFQKVHSVQEFYKSRVRILEKRLCQIIMNSQLQIKQERTSLNRLNEKCEELIRSRAREAIVWNTSIGEVQSTVEYFLADLREHHLIQITRIHQKYQAVLDQLQVKHRLLIKEEKNFIGQIQNKVLSLTELKNNQSKWIAQNIKSKNQIKDIEESIKMCCVNFQRVMRESRTHAQRQYEQAKIYVESLKRLLLNSLQEERIKRETNKEEILEMFERLLLSKNLLPR